MSLDVYGLGVLTYLLVTGQAPAASQSELHTRLEAGEGLRPSSLVDDLSEDIDFLVQAATAYDPRARMTTVLEFLETLELVEDVLTAPPSASTTERESAKDPWKPSRAMCSGTAGRSAAASGRVRPAGRSSSGTGRPRPAGRGPWLS